MIEMDALTTFGLCAVVLMLVTYALEEKSAWFTLAFAGSCALGSTYGFLQGAWPFGIAEAAWCLVAIDKWRKARLRDTLRRSRLDSPRPPDAANER